LVRVFMVIYIESHTNDCQKTDLLLGVGLLPVV